MKRLILIIFLCLVSAITANAQKNMAIARIFNDDYTKRHDVEATILQGMTLKSTGLSLFRSFKVTDNRAIAGKIERMICNDAKKASSKEMHMKGGHLAFAFLAFSKDNGKYAYLLFKQSDSKCTASVIYMEGSLTPNEVKQKFLKQ